MPGIELHVHPKCGPTIHNTDCSSYRLHDSVAAVPASRVRAVQLPWAYVGYTGASRMNWSKFLGQVILGLCTELREPMPVSGVVLVSCCAASEPVALPLRRTS